MTTFAPCLASSSATALPIPLLPPVTMATLFASDISIPFDYVELSPAKDPQRDGKGHYQPGQQDSHLRKLLTQVHALQHIATQGINRRRQRKRPHDWLQYRRETRGG